MGGCGCIFASILAILIGFEILVRLPVWLVIFLFASFFILSIFVLANRESPKAIKEKKLAELNDVLPFLQKHRNDFLGLIPKNYRITPCIKCNELEFDILGISPNGRSIEVCCNVCKKDTRWIAISHDTLQVKSEYDSYQEMLNKVKTISTYCKDTTIDTSLKIKALSTIPSHNARPTISVELRRSVWHRDGGRCVECGGDSNLEFDHIIPVARGGATTYENLQILCTKCNMRKGVSI